MTGGAAPMGARKTSSGNVVSIGATTKASAARTYDVHTGGPTDGGDTWRDSVETRLGELGSDVRKLLIGGIAAAVVLSGAGWGAYTVAMNRMTDIAVQQESIAGKIDTLDARVTGKMDAINQRLDDSDNARRTGR